MPMIGQRRPSVSAYKPTLQDRVASAAVNLFGDSYATRNFARNMFGSSGIGETGRASVADFTPLGVGFEADKAGRQAGAGHPFRAAGNLALAALPIPAVAKGAKGMIGRGVKAVQKAPPITAYHGSPHTFDQFSLDKIGTGEGAQAYGHGLYFAENEGVARNYRDQLAPGLSSGEGYAQQALLVANGDPRKALALHRQALIDNPGWDLPEGGKTLEEWAQHGVPDLTNRDGSMYQVGINADPNDFLDWDAPLSGQSGSVQERLNAAADGLRPGFKLSMDDRRGMSAYTDLALLSRAKDIQPAATEALRGAGMPGIKYLDQGSRTDRRGGGTRNFVVFDPKIIDIMKRYGVAAPVAGAMLASGVAGGNTSPNLFKEPGT